MSIQIVVVDTSPEVISQRLGALAARCEIFSIDGQRIGVSIPSKWVAADDENLIHEKLLGLTYYDLHAGEWHGQD
jgi:hypothetical protein